MDITTATTKVVVGAVQHPASRLANSLEAAAAWTERTRVRPAAALAAPAAVPVAAAPVVATEKVDVHPFSNHKVAASAVEAAVSRDPPPASLQPVTPFSLLISLIAFLRFLSLGRTLQMTQMHPRSVGTVSHFPPFCPFKLTKLWKEFLRIVISGIWTVATSFIVCVTCHSDIVCLFCSVVLYLLLLSGWDFEMRRLCCCDGGKTNAVETNATM